MNRKYKLTFIIPTMGRYRLLENLLNNIEGQTVKPDLVIIVDANKTYSKDKIKGYQFAVKYVHTGPSSLTRGRNIGIANIPSDIDLIGFLDDDVILYKDAIELMLNFWDSAPSSIGGVSFNPETFRSSRKLWPFKRIFFIGDRFPGNVLPSGYHTVVENIHKKDCLYTKCLPGGTTVWKKEVFNDFMFDEDLKGYGFYDDVDFSYRVGKRYKLLVLSRARLIHMPHSVRNRKDNLNFGLYEVITRFHFMKKHKEFSNKLFFWASFGRALENATFGIFTVNLGYLKRAAGNLLGIQRLFFNNKGGIENV